MVGRAGDGSTPTPTPINAVFIGYSSNSSSWSSMRLHKMDIMDQSQIRTSWDIEITVAVMHKKS